MYTEVISVSEEVFKSSVSLKTILLFHFVVGSIFIAVVCSAGVGCFRCGSSNIMQSRKFELCITTYNCNSNCLLELLQHDGIGSSFSVSVDEG